MRITLRRKQATRQRHTNSKFQILRAGCKISSLAGGRERGRPAGRGAVGRDKCSSGEHPVGLFADRTRLELILQRTLSGPWRPAPLCSTSPSRRSTRFWATAFSRGEFGAALFHAAAELSVYEAERDAGLATTSSP